MRNDLEIKREIFDLYENARSLFNDFYNGHEGTYTEHDISSIETIISFIENNIDNIKEEI